MGHPSLALGLALSLTLAACAPGAAHEPAYPLFDVAAVSRSCEANTAEFLSRPEPERTAGVPRGITWARDLDEAIDRARREGKPIFMVTHVRASPNLGLDPECQT